ncbi:S9 family peptidase [soil metagenome]
MAAMTDIPADTAPELDLDNYLALPRVAGLDVSPHGRQLVTSVGQLDPDGTAYVTALWAIDPEGHAPPRRVTRSAKGESDPRFAPDGSVLFTSARPDPEMKDADDDPVARLWRLPAEGGEAALVADPPGGVVGFAVAREDGRVVLGANIHPDADSWKDDTERGKTRKDRKVTAQLFETYPVRFWDRWYGPRERQLFAQADASERPAFHALTPRVAFALEEQEFDLAPDGATLVTSWWTSPTDPRDRVLELVAIAIDHQGRPGERRVLAAGDRLRYASPKVAPDGTAVVALRAPLATPDGVPDLTLVLVDLASGEQRDLLEGFDRWPQAPVWSPDGSAVFFTADEDGCTRPYRVDIATGDVTRLATEGAYTDLTPAPDGSALYALRSHWAYPPAVVALDPAAADQEPRPLLSPGAGATPPARVERVETSAGDGVRVPGWLVLPEHQDGPAPLVVFIHGGPLGSWSGWSWRWNPQLLAARGYAVLLPDPALSTGYGLGYIQRGWGRWGAEPYTDILALVDAVEARADIDAERTAAMGGSFGGYMANWVASHTDRFDAIVTHASLWNLEAFHGATDLGPWWENEFGDRYTDPSRYQEWSPHRHVDSIRTPMLVIHGEKDYRVPVSEGLTLWTDLARHGVDAKYLHFPDENHWVLKPEHTRVWYETVYAFLDHHVRGEKWERPDLL